MIFFLSLNKVIRNAGTYIIIINYSLMEKNHFKNRILISIFKPIYLHLLYDIVGRENEHFNKFI